jgi:hypothetical protein
MGRVRPLATKVTARGAAPAVGLTVNNVPGMLIAEAHGDVELATELSVNTTAGNAPDGAVGTLPK